MKNLTILAARRTDFMLASDSAEEAIALTFGDLCWKLSFVGLESGDCAGLSVETPSPMLSTGASGSTAGRDAGAWPPDPLATDLNTLKTFSSSGAESACGHGCNSTCMGTCMHHSPKQTDNESKRRFVCSLHTEDDESASKVLVRSFTEEDKKKIHELINKLLDWSDASFV